MERRSLPPTAPRGWAPKGESKPTDPALPANPAVRYVLATVLVEAASLLVFYLRAH